MSKRRKRKRKMRKGGYMERDKKENEEGCRIN